MGFSLEICPAVLYMLNIGELSNKESAAIEILLQNLLVKFMHLPHSVTHLFLSMSK